MRILRKAALIMCAAFVALATIGCEKEPKPTPEPGPDPVDPAKPLVEGTFEVKVDELTADSVTITITPSEEVDYFYACLTHGSSYLWLSLEAFPRGFPMRLSHEAFPQGCPTCHLGVRRSSA